MVTKKFVCALTLGLLLFSRAASATSIVASDDTSVYTNFGTEVSYILSGYAGSAGDGEVARDYLKFGLPVAAPNTFVSSASLILSYQTAYNGANNPLSIFASSDGWSQGAITWSNQPGLGASLASFNPLTALTTVTIDVTSFVNGEYLGDGTASLIVAATSEFFTGGTPNSWRYFFGPSFGGNVGGPPVLDITIEQTQAVPEPSTLVLFGAGLLGLGAMRRRRKAKA